MKQLEIETDREADGRWIAEIPAIPGAMAYGSTEEEAREKVCAIAVQTVATSSASTSYTPDPQSP